MKRPEIIDLKKDYEKHTGHGPSQHYMVAEDIQKDQLSCLKDTTRRQMRNN